MKGRSKPPFAWLGPPQPFWVHSSCLRGGGSWVWLPGWSLQTCAFRSRPTEFPPGPRSRLLGTALVAHASFSSARAMRATCAPQASRSSLCACVVWWSLNRQVRPDHRVRWVQSVRQGTATVLPFSCCESVKRCWLASAFMQEGPMPSGARRTSARHRWFSHGQIKKYRPHDTYIQPQAS